MILAVLAGVLEGCGRRECNFNVIADLSDAGFSALLPSVVARRDFTLIDLACHLHPCCILFLSSLTFFCFCLRLTDLGPRDSVTMGIEEQFILLSLGLITIGVRMGVRIRQIGFGGWQLDDYLMPITGVSGAITRRCKTHGTVY